MLCANALNFRFMLLSIINILFFFLCFLRTCVSNACFFFVYCCSVNVKKRSYTKKKIYLKALWGAALYLSENGQFSFLVAVMQISFLFCETVGLNIGFSVGIDDWYEDNYKNKNNYCILKRIYVNQNALMKHIGQFTTI